MFSFLTANPKYQSKFSKFASVPAGSLGGNAEVKEQALVIMKKLDEIINAHDVDAAVRDMAANHKKRNVLLTDFNVRHHAGLF